MKEIVLDAPGKNAISTDLMQRTLAAVRAAKGESILLTGAGDAFSAGLNLKEVVDLDLAGMQRFLALLDELVVTLYEHPAPVVALVNGHAIAGGCVLALTGDFRVMPAGGKARIGLNEVALGLPFPPRVMALCKARIGRENWERVVLGAGLMGADEALGLGLIDEVSQTPEASARQALERWSSHPHHAYAAAKRAMRSGALAVSERELARFLEHDLPIWASAEQKQRLASVLAR